MSKDAFELCEPGALQRALERYTAAAGRGYAAVAFAAGGKVTTASVNGTPDRRAPVGCVAKLLTATLVTGGARRGDFALDAPVTELLGVAPDALHGVTVRQLLEHTHGLDDSLLAAPRHASGFIERRELMQRVAALARWARPGEHYSYGHGGAWLLAAMLERVRGRTFAALVRDELLGSFAIEGARATAELCAALGTGLALTAEELARFGLHALASDAAVVAAPIAPLPGWHPLERGVCLGWKAASGGWFGHQSVWPGASIYLRVQPAARFALAVVAAKQAAALVALGLFGEHFAELFDGRARLPAEQRGPLPPGTYAQAAQVVSVASTPRGLCAEAWQVEAGGAQRGSRSLATLVPVGGVLFALPSNELVPYLEAIEAAPNEVWLWNGRVVLRGARDQAAGAIRR
jgi:CubicO group peptidase (beta-lactamase class C family)